MAEPFIPKNLEFRAYIKPDFGPRRALGLVYGRSRSAARINAALKHGCLGSAIELKPTKKNPNA